VSRRLGFMRVKLAMWLLVGLLGCIYLQHTVDCLVFNHGKAVLRRANRLRPLNMLSERVGNYKVSVIGASGGIGQPLSLMLQRNPYIKKLSLYDVQKSVHGVAADLSHCSHTPVVTGHCGVEELSVAVIKSDVVIIPAGKSCLHCG
jgi:5,10-methylene-tetrahydrofolate dehydrogenase/methenyl tetrahydrofolate cyclohydrolase